jgi:hypothetical protein
MKLAWPKLSKPIRIAGCLLALSPFVFAGLSVCSGVREEVMDVSCISNQKILASELRMYAQDYDDHLPPAAKWMDASTRYTKTDSAYRCPKLRNEHPEDYGYALNSLLSSQSLSKIQSPDTTPMVFDSDWLWRNAHAPGFISLANPPRHHSGGVDSVIYVDGHTKFIRPPALPVKPLSQHQKAD